MGLSFPDVTSSRFYRVRFSAASSLLYSDVAGKFPEGSSGRLPDSEFGILLPTLPVVLRVSIRSIPPVKRKRRAEVSVAALEAGDTAALMKTVYGQQCMTIRLMSTVWCQIPERLGSLWTTRVYSGLAALNNGDFFNRQFLDLNRDISGFDRDMNHVPERHQSDRRRRRAIESGKFYGGAGLASTPVIDYRTYMDARRGDIHVLVRQFSAKQRLANANGHTENHVMQIGGRWGFTEQAPDLGALFAYGQAG